MLNPERLDRLFQDILARAGVSEDFRQRGLGPIHLLNNVYLADLYHAARNHGETFTGVGWRFHHFGPWSQAAFDRIEPALLAAAALQRRVSSRYADDYVRYRFTPEDARSLASRFEEELPIAVTQAVARAVDQHGTDTADLLRHVYLTPPMLAARPGAALDLTTAVEPQVEDATDQTSETRLKRRERQRRTEVLKQHGRRSRNAWRLGASAASRRLVHATTTFSTRASRPSTASWASHWSAPQVNLSWTSPSGSHDNAVTPTYPDASVQTLVGPFWEPDSSGTPTRGRLVKVIVPYPDMKPHRLVPIGRGADGRQHDTATYRLEEFRRGHPTGRWTRSPWRPFLSEREKHTSCGEARFDLPSYWRRAARMSKTGLSGTPRNGSTLRRFFSRPTTGRRLMGPAAGGIESLSRASSVRSIRNSCGIYCLLVGVMTARSCASTTSSPSEQTSPTSR